MTANAATTAEPAAKVIANSAATHRAPSRIPRFLTLAVIAVGATAVFAFVLFPFFWMVKSSFQTDLTIMAIPPIWLPSELTLRSYSRALTLVPFGRYISNSILVSGVTTIICTIFAAMAGYVLGRHKFPGATLLFVFFLFTQLIPSITASSLSISCCSGCT